MPKIIPFSSIEKEIKVGDIIGCQGNRLISRIIRLIRGGKWGWSHVSIIIRDNQNEGTGRVSVLEALLSGGMRRNYLSEIYEASHGKLFWLQMNCDQDQKMQLMELGAQLRERKTKYDFKSTVLAMFAPIFIDKKKFNCSESAWYLLTSVGRLLRRFDKNEREIAPVPGDFPAWSGIEPVEIDMKN